MSDVPMIPLYRPMSVGQVLDRVYLLLRGNFGVLIGVASIPGLIFLGSYGVIFAIWGREFLSLARGSNPEQVMHLMRLISAFFLPLMLVYLAAFALYLAAASYAAVLADCGKRVTVREAYQVAWSRMGHYLLLILTLYAVSFLPALLLELPIFAAVNFMGANQATPNPTMLLLFPLEMLLIFAAVVGGAIIALRLSLAFPASLFESLKVKESIKRSWRLTRGALGRIFLVALVIYAAIYAAILILMFGALSVGAIGMLFAGTGESHSHLRFGLLVTIGIVVYLAVIAIATVGTWAGFTTAFAVLYNDQRLRLEGQPPVTPTGVPA